MKKIFNGADSETVPQRRTTSAGVALLLGEERLEQFHVEMDWNEGISE